MTTNRLEAFSDAVLAIIITIMVLEFKIPESSELAALKPLVPKLVTYILSFIYLGIYWSNHHHLMDIAEKVDHKVLWANMHLLFWLSLFPFATGYMGENHFTPIPTAIYGFVLFMASISWLILVRQLRNRQDVGSHFNATYSTDHKQKSLLSSFVYLIASAISLMSPITGCILYTGIAIVWLTPYWQKKWSNL